MISRLKINGYKKFKDISIENMSIINIFLGANNMGKTTILESIYGWSLGHMLKPFLGACVARGQYYATTRVYSIAEAILSSVNRCDNKLGFSFSAEENGKIVTFEHNFIPSFIFQPLEWIPAEMNYEYSVSEKSFLYAQDGQSNFFIGKWIVKENNNDEYVYEICSDNRNDTTQYAGGQSHCASCYYRGYNYNPIDNMLIYNTLKRRGMLREFVAGLKKNFPDIKALDAIPYPDSTFGFVNVEKEDGSSLPIYSYGDGLQKWYSILGEMLKTSGGLICIDEIDAAFHPEMQGDFSKYLLDYARKNNTQVFATTHNLEWIDHLLKSYNEEELEKYVRIYKVSEDELGFPNVSCLTGIEAAEVRREYCMEIR